MLLPELSVKRVFGLLKRRFQSLLITLMIDKVDLIPMHIFACCILHNVCLMRSNNIEETANEQILDHNVVNDENMHDAVHEGIIKQDLRVQRLRIRNV